MKLKELIEKLQKFDPELLVVVDGYEGGVDYPKEPVELSIKLNQHTENYYGRHEVQRIPDNTEPDGRAVFIPRPRHPEIVL